MELLQPIYPVKGIALGLKLGGFQSSCRCSGREKYITTEPVGTFLLWVVLHGIKCGKVKINMLSRYTSIQSYGWTNMLKYSGNFLNQYINLKLGSDDKFMDL